MFGLNDWQIWHHHYETTLGTVKENSFGLKRHARKPSLWMMSPDTTSRAHQPVPNLDRK